jgi:hypothetical protein
MNVYKRAYFLWQLMAIVDTRDMYYQLVACLRVAYNMEDGWPPPPAEGSKYHEYNFADFPGIKIHSKDDFDVYVDVAKIVMRMPGVSDKWLPRIEFCNRNGAVLRVVESNDTSHMFKDLRRVIAGDYSTPAMAPPSSVVVAPPVDWTELAKRVLQVVGDFRVDPTDEEAIQAKKALLTLVRSLLQVLTLRSRGARGSGGGCE